MNIKRIGLCVLALIVMGISYWLAVGVNYDSKTVRIDPEAHTLVNSSDAIISKRILAMKTSGSQVYFLGYEGRYSFVVNENLPAELHPGESAFITVNNDTIGIIGKLNPKFEKEPVYVLEINLDKLLAKKTGKMKYKEISKFPTVKKDLSIIVDNKVQSSEIATQIKKAAGSLLLNSEVFDLYAGKGIGEGKKSLAFALTFGANDRTLTNQEINDVLEKIVDRLSKIGEIRQK